MISKFDGEACAICTSTTSIMIGLLIGKTKEEALNIIENYKNMIDERTILILFDCINKYGDRNMNQDYFMNIKNKTYTLYLCLREKTKPENNLLKR